MGLIFAVPVAMDRISESKFKADFQRNGLV